MLVGQQIGPFAVEKELGSGAMGAVYLARYTKTGQYVAIKIIAPGLGSSEKALARFEREADILKQLKHPNIVRLVATGKVHGSPFYAMEYIEGETLDDVLKRRDRYTWEEVVELGKQICEALQHAHAHGIIHRDLKPSNLMITSDATVKLTDFGIAKDLDVTQLTTANCTVGTAAYMSPEQCRGERDLTYKSDLYSLGVLFYELLTGRKPFHAESALDMFMQHIKGKFERPSRLALEIPIWLDTLVCQLLEKKPEHRPLDAAMVAKALDEVREKVDTLQSAGVGVAATVARRSKDETDRHAAATLVTGKRKKRKKKSRAQKYQVAFVAGGLGLGLIGIVALIAYALWPASAEKLYQQGFKQVQRGDQLFDEGAKLIEEGRKDEAVAKWDALWYEWDEAKHKYLEPVLGKDPDGPHAEKAKEQLEHIKQGNLYIRGWKALADKSKESWRQAKEKGFELLLTQYPPGGKFVERARNDLQPLEAPYLLEQGQKFTRAKEIEDQQKARSQLDLLVKRYSKSEEAKKAWVILAMEEAGIELEQAKKEGRRPVSVNNRAKDAALEALYWERNQQLEKAKSIWSELSRMSEENPDYRPWVLLAKERLRESSR